ncbi:ESX secretion-associated protein EspG [Aldersonia sp. NBC_00410]|uniref:ESX secretion-associated protein EspG n=1 Tax=Aldersonia sp. NBC_00410 TaxID=2975954 RepID=UPI00225589EC|nr:ESX secretion-associated protein EspG [Aldersonia sp. NBC_00410]MCX5043404.1 ESX secretion-associated protein EspG [Aldersonia sp. NBC_00410]
MSTRTWRLAALEFEILWEQFGRDRLPYPLQYRSPIESAVDYQRQRRAAAQGLQTYLDETLHRAVATIADTSLWVAAYGLDNLGQPGESVVRVNAGVSGGLATIAVQEPGPAEDIGGDIVLTAAPAAQLPDLLAAALPSREPGRQRGFSVQEAELRRGEGDRFLADVKISPARERVSRFLNRPRISAGEVVAAPGVAVDARANRDMRGFQWADFAGDGRYLTRRTDTLTIEPATRTTVADWFTTLIASIDGTRRR